MSERTFPDFSELAYHIIIICDFWKRSKGHLQHDRLEHVIGTMIGISLGLDNANRMARAVIEELDSLRLARTDDEVDPEGIEVVFISAFLNEQFGALADPATTVSVSD